MELINKEIKIIKSDLSDLDDLMNIFAEARMTIAKLGIDQWQDGYPQREVITDDITGLHSYCVKLDNNPIATFALFSEGENAYDKIFDGKWLTDSPSSINKENVSYIAIHHVAISLACRGKGISTQIIEFAKSFAKINNKNSLRIDTHAGNIVMRKMLEKHGFKHCGTVYYDSGIIRVAYELVVD